VEEALFADSDTRRSGGKYNLHSDDFAGWKRHSQPVEKAAAADAWYLARSSDIEAKRVDYMQSGTGWSRRTRRC
jgi:hypothetical protein